MKIISNIATLSMAFGLAVFAGSFLFGAGTLSVVGWLVTAPLFLGATGHVALSIYNMLPERKDKKVKGEVEIDAKKPAGAAA